MFSFKKIEINTYYQTFVLLGYRRNLSRKVKVMVIFLLITMVKPGSNLCGLSPQVFQLIFSYFSKIRLFFIKGIQIFCEGFAELQHSTSIIKPKF